MTTYSKLYFQIIFSVKNRNKLIPSSWEDQLYKYIASVLKAKGAKPYIINGMPDHIHIFLGTRPDINISYLVQEIKKASSKFSFEEEYKKILEEHNVNIDPRFFI